MPGVRELEGELGVSYSLIYPALRDLGIRFPGRRGWSAGEYSLVLESLRSLGLRASTRRRSPTEIEVSSITMGADPEFEVITPGREFDPAHRHFREHEQIGTDSRSDTGELRPRPGTPERVTRNLGTLLRRVASTLPDGWNIRAGAGLRVPLGGHIHFGGSVTRNPSAQLLSALDRFVGIPLNAKSNNSQRGSYALPSQWRSQPHGWEYRTPCSWLAHPDLAQGALTIAHKLVGLNDGQLDALQTREDLFSIMGNRRPVAERFYQLLDETPRLELVNVFAAWMGERYTHSAPIDPQTYEVRVSNDENLDAVRRMRLRAPIPGVEIVGAAQRRTGESVVFVPESVNLQAATPIPVQHWELASIGISWEARSSATLEDLRATLQTILDSTRAA